MLADIFNLKKPKVILAFIHDFIAVFLAWVISFLLRFNFDIPISYLNLMFTVAPKIIFFQLIIFIYMGLYRGFWRFSSLEDLKRIIISAFIFFIFLLFLNFIHFFSLNIPRSIILIYPILVVCFLGISRFFYRLHKEQNLFNFIKFKNGEPIIIIGAGKNTVNILKDLNENQSYNVIGILDNDKSLHDREIHNVKILSKISYLTEVVKQYRIKHVIISISDKNSIDRIEAIKLSSSLKLKTMIVPSVAELVSGQVTFSSLRNVDINDLLGRNIVNLHSKKIKYEFNNKTILITGAGGSIGSELCRQVEKYHPKKIICLDISELNIYKLEQYFSNLKTRTEFVYLLKDIKNIKSIEEIVRKFKPNIIFHSAAYKHVPIVENNNVAEAFTNNVVGTYNLALLAKRNNIDKFILISTDKAVNPTNIMGATKRLSEMVCQGFQNNCFTNFVTVRFGNVLDSSGSVIPKFRNQIERGEPITVTHPDITRFFMAIPEAAQLVLQAGAMGKGGEIFVLDMGEPVKIFDLAKTMIRLSGLDENDVKINFTGLRAGEKLYEEILIQGENILPTRHKKIFIAKTKEVKHKWVTELLQWIKTIDKKPECEVKNELKKWVNEYKRNN